jgi:hypothetical protein
MQIHASTTSQPNPYQSPSDLPAVVQPNPLRDVLGSMGRLDFEVIIEREDLMDAIARAGYRPEVRSTGQLLRVLALPSILITALAFAVDSPGVLIATIFIWIALFAVLFLARHRLIQAYANLNNDLIGHAKGYMDDRHFVINQPHQTRVLLMDQLVSVRKNSRRLVLCFDATLNRFETLPFEAFKQVNLAQMIAGQLARVRPVVQSQPIDRRRAELPDSEPIFQASTQAIHYSGPVSMSALHSSELSRHWSRSIHWAAFRICAFSAVLVAAVITVLGASIAALIICCGGLAAFIPTWIRLFRIDRELRRDDQPLWQAKGWVESEGIVSMTTIGQVKTSWSVFGERTISEQHIVLRYAKAPLWYVLSRDQFQSDDDWNAACQLIRDHIKTD